MSLKLQVSPSQEKSFPSFSSLWGSSKCLANSESSKPSWKHPETLLWSDGCAFLGLQHSMGRAACGLPWAQDLVPNNWKGGY